MLDEFLAENNVRVERGVELESLKLPSDREATAQPEVTLRHLYVTCIQNVDASHGY